MTIKNTRLYIILSLGAFVFSTLLLPQSASANWYWLTIPTDPTIGEFTELSAIEYAVTSIPKDQLITLPDNFMGALSSTTYSAKCADKYDSVEQQLREFDKTHSFYVYACVDSEIKGHQDCGQVVSQETITARNSLINSIYTGAISCLKSEQDELQRQADKEAQAKRQAEIQTALAECDFDFFENEMTNKERMDTWTERQTCKEKTLLQTNEVVQGVAIPTQTIPVQPSLNQIPQVINTVPTPVNSDRISDTNEAVAVNDDTSTSSIVLDSMGSEAVESTPTEVPQIDETVTKPSFFKRVINFLSQLFAW